jgi:hypothetical protein
MKLVKTFAGMTALTHGLSNGDSRIWLGGPAPELIEVSYFLQYKCPDIFGPVRFRSGAVRSGSGPGPVRTFWTLNFFDRWYVGGNVRTFFGL